LTNSIIFQDGYCTTNQVFLLGVDRKANPSDFGHRGWADPKMTHDPPGEEDAFHFSNIVTAGAMFLGVGFFCLQRLI
jgi:hypothetical protein